jgi:chemotaxis methyl-accepting protein methylase
MRKIRNSLSERYITKPDLENSDLKEIRKKYKIKNAKNPQKMQRKFGFYFLRNSNVLIYFDKIGK